MHWSALSNVASFQCSGINSVNEFHCISRSSQAKTAILRVLRSPVCDIHENSHCFWRGDEDSVVGFIQNEFVQSLG